MTNLKTVTSGVRTGLLVVSIVVLLIFVRWLLATTSSVPASTRSDAGATSASGSKRFGVTIRQPPAPPRVDLGVTDGAGNAVTAACSTCHSKRAPDPLNRTAADLRTFHQGLTFTHGSVTCLSCHNVKDYDSLVLADGTPLAYADVMRLCAQCHGRQARDYLHGAHGGMSGYWDLSRGPRVRNSCVDCHDPHAPAFPRMKPTFKPRDRFLEPLHE